MEEGARYRHEKLQREPSDLEDPILNYENQVEGLILIFTFQIRTILQNCTISDKTEESPVKIKVWSQNCGEH